MSEQKCAALTCPCGCGKVVRYWHVAECPDDCNIEGDDEYRPPSLQNDRTAMMLGLSPDTRPAEERCQIGDSQVGQCLGNRGHNSPHAFENLVDARITDRRQSVNTHLT